MVNFSEVSLGLFAASTIIIFIYALLSLISVGISLSVIFKGRKDLSKGHMRKFMSAFSITLAVSFLYAVWNVLTKMEIINIRNAIAASMIDNLILVAFIMLLTYVAYLARGISSKFGFRSIGKKVSEMAKK